MSDEQGDVREEQEQEQAGNGADAQDDFALRTNFEGHVLGTRYKLSDRMALHVWGLFSSVEDDDAYVAPGDTDHDPWRVRLDLDVKF